MDLLLMLLVFLGVGVVVAGFYIILESARTRKSNPVSVPIEDTDRVELLNRAIGELNSVNLTYLSRIQELDETNKQLLQVIEQEKEVNKKIISQKKSSETRLGNISENIAPFLEQFPYDPKNCHFLGMPIDFIVFDYDQAEIIFLEVKTGGSRESQRQRLIKEIIKSGRVYYEKIQINEKGVNGKKEKNYESALPLKESPSEST
jgi:predicted Holliday junction resolvase-like endonuclease